MPITREDDGSLFLAFGQGDILTGTTIAGGGAGKVLVFKQGEPGPGGRTDDIQVGIPLMELEIPLMMYFPSRGCVESLIEVLQKLADLYPE